MVPCLALPYAALPGFAWPCLALLEGAGAPLTGKPPPPHFPFERTIYLPHALHERRGTASSKGPRHAPRTAKRQARVRFFSSAWIS